MRGRIFYISPVCEGVAGGFMLNKTRLHWETEKEFWYSRGRVPSYIMHIFHRLEIAS
jgi:hypothetical protein